VARNGATAALARRVLVRDVCYPFGWFGFGSRGFRPQQVQAKEQA